MYKMNENEKVFTETLRMAERYVKGELELDNFDGEWFAMDYRKEFECAFPIEIAPFDKPLITDEEAEQKGIYIEECAEAVGAWIVGESLIGLAKTRVQEEDGRDF